ncbi:Hypothetical predicted protein [Lecanosticta acicola]|uniref:Uncharacterized protein n=1 Tax=Lecanosticta acicola TaxID=111012 RepID=A0AAI8YRY7_9PEZI|nr:Hypothetical predicted protein [Lecanosticta acicola]
MELAVTGDNVDVAYKAAANALLHLHRLDKKRATELLLQDPLHKHLSDSMSGMELKVQGLEKELYELKTGCGKELRSVRSCLSVALGSIDKAAEDVHTLENSEGAGKEDQTEQITKFVEALVAQVSSNIGSSLIKIEQALGVPSPAAIAQNGGAGKRGGEQQDVVGLGSVPKQGRGSKAVRGSTLRSNAKRGRNVVAQRSSMRLAAAASAQSST